MKIVFSDMIAALAEAACARVLRGMNLVLA